MKEIKDYLHLYLGCEIEHDTGKWRGTLCSIGFHTANIHCDYLQRITAGHKIPDSKDWGYFDIKIHRLKPILRPLSDMTEEEWKAIMLEFSIDIVDAYNSYIRYGDKPKHILILENRLTTNTLKFNDGMILLRKYFDLFGLIESGLAIDKTTLNQKP